MAEIWQLTSGSPTATATALSMPSGMTSSQANTIAISGSDVYVAGTVSNSTGGGNAVLWVNGAVTLLPIPSGLTGDYIADGIAVLGSNVYVAGTTIPDVGTDTAIYWANNGAATTLSIPPNDSAGNYDTGGITVSGSDVYAVGFVGNSNAAYWVNGGQATLLPMPSGTYMSRASAIAAATQ